PVSRVLVAGIGNVFLGDDAFGVEVVAVLAGRELPAGVAVADFGIRGFDLAYALMEDWAAAILVDALPRGEPAGTVCRPGPGGRGPGAGAAGQPCDEPDGRAGDGPAAGRHAAADLDRGLRAGGDRPGRRGAHGPERAGRRGGRRGGGHGRGAGQASRRPGRR